MPLDFIGTDPSWGIYLLAHDYTPPALETQKAGSADTDGDPVVQSKYGDRVITARVRIVEPPDAATTNLATNPTGALGTTSWAGVSLLAGPTRIVMPADLPSGKGIDTALEARTNAAGDRLVHEGISVVDGEPFRASIYVHLDALSATGVRVVVYDATGAVRKAEGATYDIVADGCARLDVGFVADETGNWRVGVEQVGAGAATFWATGLQVEPGEDLTPFFCGDTPGCDWNGPRHAATATRPPPDGTRFSRIYRDLTRQLDRIKRTKTGTLRRIAPGFEAITFDLLTAAITDAPQDISLGMKRAEIAFSFEADPGGRTAEVQVGVPHEETALPCLTFLAEEIPGDLEALGRLLIEDKQGQGQLVAYWGAQHDTYSSSANAALFYEAESRSPKGAAALAAVAGASGAGNNTILHGGLLGQFQSVFSTQAAGAGAHLSHVGSYRVIARTLRPSSNAGQVTMRLDWSQGDFVNTNPGQEVAFEADDRENRFVLSDMGIVDIAEPPSGTTPRWEGRVLAKSTVAGDDLYVDCLFLIPVTEASGQVVGSGIVAPAGALMAYDGFPYGAGSLAGKVAELGGTWGGGGDADDFQTGTGVVSREAISDAAGVGRYEWLSETKYTAAAIKANITTAAGVGTMTGKLFHGTFLRYVDTNNWLMAVLTPGVESGGLLPWKADVYKKVAGVKTLLGSAPLGSYFAGEIVSVDVELIANGTTWAVKAKDASTIHLSFSGEASGVDAVLGTTLKEGRIGIYHENQLATIGESGPPTWRRLEAWEPVLDQAIYPSRQLEIRSSLARRQDVGGVTWGKAPYEGQYLTLIPSGPEKIPTRFIVKATRDPNADEGIDDIAATLFVQPRYLVAPPA